VQSTPHHRTCFLVQLSHLTVEDDSAKHNHPQEDKEDHQKQSLAALVENTMQQLDTRGVLSDLENAEDSGEAKRAQGSQARKKRAQN